MCVACKVPCFVGFFGFVFWGLLLLVCRLVGWLGFFNMTLHSVIDISRKRASTFSAGTVRLQQVDHALAVPRQCMQSNSNS